MASSQVLLHLILAQLSKHFHPQVKGWDPQGRGRFAKFGWGQGRSEEKSLHLSPRRQQSASAHRKTKFGTSSSCYTGNKEGVSVALPSPPRCPSPFPAQSRAAGASACREAAEPGVKAQRGDGVGSERVGHGQRALEGLRDPFRHPNPIGGGGRREKGDL